MITLTLDILKYEISNADNKTPFRRAIERRLKKTNEFEHLFDLMKNKFVDEKVAPTIDEQRNEAMNLMSQQDYIGARTIFLNLLKTEKDDWSLYYMTGQCLRFTNMLPQAIKLLTHAAKMNPKEPSVSLALGVALQLSGSLEEAKVELKKTVALDSSYFFAYNSLGLTCRKLGQFAEALMWYSRAEDLLDAAAIKTAKEIIEKHESRVKEDPDIVSSFHEDLFTVTERVKMRDTNFAILLNNIGVCHLELEEFDLAQNKFYQSIELTPLGIEYSDPHQNLEIIESRLSPK